MKRLLQRSSVAGMVLALFSLQNPGFSQGYLLNENFENFPSYLPGGQNSNGWTTQTVAGDSTVDRWFFNNYIGYDVPLPLQGKVAVADAYNGGYTNTLTNNQNEHDLKLISPVVSTVGINNLELTWDELYMPLPQTHYGNVTVDVSTNGGSTWTNVYFNTTGGFFSTSKSVNLNSYVGYPTLQIRFGWYNPAYNPSTVPTTTHGYWMIDNIKLFTRFANDVGVAAVVNPANNACPDPDQQLGVRVTNYGTSTANSIGVNLTVGGAASGNFSTTISSLNAGASTTVFTGNTINTTAGGTVNFTSYTTYGSDQTSTNDTLITSIITAPKPTDPSGSNIVQCGVGPVSLVANASPGEHTVWYNDMSTTTALGEGNPYITPFTVYGSRTFYAENTRTLPSMHTNYLTGVYRWNTGNEKAIFFDLTAANEVVLDSFASNFAYQGTYIVTVYYKTGTYYGFANNQSAFTMLAIDTVTTTVLGQPGFIDLKGTKLRLGAGTTYGFVLTVKYGPTVGNPPEFAFKIGTTSGLSNDDLSIYAEGVSNLAWSSFVTGYSGDVRIYYQKVCKSERKGIDVVIIPRPAGVQLIPGTGNQGKYASGVQNDPDVARMNAPFVYELVPPNTFSNTDFGTGWTITWFDFRTVNGNAPNSSDTSTTIPGSGPGTLTFTPTGNVDTMYVVTLTILDIVKNCDTTLYRYIMVGADPYAHFSTAAVCEGDAASFNNMSSISSGFMTYRWYFGDGDSSDLGNPTHAYQVAGNYTVTLRATSNHGFVSLFDSVITVYEIPGANFTVANVCEGETHQFTDASYIPSIGTPVYEWDFNDGSPKGTAQNPAHQYSVPGLYQVTLTVNVNGCVDSRMKYVTLSPRAVPDFSVQTVCNNTNAAFLNGTALSSGTFGSRWDFGDGSIGTGNNPSHKYSSFGNIAVKLIVTTDMGCIDSVSKTISLDEAPVPDFSMSGLCSKELVNFTNLTPAVGSGNGYLWDFGNNLTSTQDNPSTEFPSPGTYVIKLVAEAPNGCKDSLIRSVVIDTKPMAGFNVENVCLGTPSEFRNSTYNIPGGASWQWDFGNSTGSTAEDTAFTYAGPGDYTVNLLVTSPNGCMDLVSSIVSVYELPDATFTASSAQIGDGTMYFEGPSGSGYTYLWFMGDGNRYETQNVTHTYENPGNFEVRLMVSNTDGCENESTGLVAVFPTGINMQQNQVQVYPNPGNGVFTIVLSKGISSDDSRVIVQDMNGKTIHSQDFQGIETRINPGVIAPGTYLIQIHTGNEVYTTKLVVIGN